MCCDLALLVQIAACSAELNSFQDQATKSTTKLAKMEIVKQTDLSSHGSCFVG